MKKIFFLLLFCCSTLFSFSQNEQASKAVKIGIRTSASQFHLTDFYEWRDFFCIEGCSVSGFESGHSFSIGIASSFRLNNELEFIIGLDYALKSYYEDGNNFFTPYHLRRNLKYLQVPILFRYKFYSTETKKVQTYVDLGFNTLMNLNQSENEFSYEDTLQDVSFNVQTGLGLAINFEKITLAIGPQFSYAFTNFGGKRRSDGPFENKLRPFELGLGISIFR